MGAAGDRLTRASIWQALRGVRGAAARAGRAEVASSGQPVNQRRRAPKPSVVRYPSSVLTKS